MGSTAGRSPPLPVCGRGGGSGVEEACENCAQHPVIQLVAEHPAELRVVQVRHSQTLGEVRRVSWLSDRDPYHRVRSYAASRRDAQAAIIGWRRHRAHEEASPGRRPNISPRSRRRRRPRTLLVDQLRASPGLIRPATGHTTAKSFVWQIRPSRIQTTRPNAVRPFPRASSLVTGPLTSRAGTPTWIR
jgi:hypothetical protein